MATLTTFAQVGRNLEKFENTPPTTETPATPTVETPVETSPAPTAPDTTQVAEQPVVETPEQETPEANEVSFNLNFSGEETPTQETPAQTTTTAQPAVDWKAELKKLPKEEVVKELGLSDFALELDNYIKSGGNAADYIAAKSVDWNQITDEDIVKDNFRKQYPNLSKQEIDRLYVRKYGVNELTDEDEAQDRAIQLKADAHTVRQAKIAEQSKFKVPDAITPQVDEAYENWRQMIAEQPKLVDEQRRFFESHEATKNLNESKRVTISLGDGVPPFNINIDNPQAITKALTDDGTTWRMLTSTKTGEPDVQKQQLITLFAYDPQAFMQGIFNYGASRGVHKKLVEEGQNAQRPQQKALPPEPSAKPVVIGQGRFGDRNR